MGWKVYRGRRLPGDTVVTVETNDDSYELPHHVHHSPDGFEWGYGGSGPAELAKDILWDFLGEQPSPQLYQQFKWDLIAPVQSDTLVIRDTDVSAWLEGRER